MRIAPGVLELGLELGRTHASTPGFVCPHNRGSVARATLRCVGVGKCRRTDAGTMCPSYMATREEKHSTRGRARLAAFVRIRDHDTPRRREREPEDLAEKWGMASRFERKSSGNPLLPQPAQAADDAPRVYRTENVLSISRKALADGTWRTTFRFCHRSAVATASASGMLPLVSRTTPAR